VVRARQLFCQVAVLGMGYSGATVARFLGRTTSALNRLVAWEAHGVTGLVFFARDAAFDGVREVG
jgi:hypothetical protein